LSWARHFIILPKVGHAPKLGLQHLGSHPNRIKLHDEGLVHQPIYMVDFEAIKKPKFFLGYFQYTTIDNQMVFIL
jgi:hypothetical protein